MSGEFHQLHFYEELKNTVPKCKNWQNIVAKLEKHECNFLPEAHSFLTLVAVNLVFNFLT